MPFSSTEVKICSANGKILDINEVGELVLRGPQMMKGYFNREEETTNTIRDGWLWTGDLAVMDEDGYITIKARQKNLIKYKGHSVYPAEVEDLLYNNETIEEVGVIGIIDETGNENIKAFIALKPEYKGKISEEDIIEWSKKNMGFEKYPRFVEFIDEVPKTTVGKVYHLELRKMEQARATLVKKGATIGANATVVCGVTLGRYCFIGAGAVVNRSVDDHALMVGNPAAQIGWACTCGERLNDALTCDHCQAAYRKTATGLAEM